MTDEVHGGAMAAARARPGLNWPAGLAPRDADLFAHSEIDIAAQSSVVWRRLVEAPRWPEWYPGAEDVRILTGWTEVLDRHTRFAFRAFGVELEALVGEYAPYSRLGWFGAGPDLQAYHTWLLLSGPDGCHVVTEQVADGRGAVALGEPDPDVLRKGQHAWLRALKQLCEG